MQRKWEHLLGEKIKEEAGPETNETPLEKHIQYFGGVKGNQPISLSSIATQNMKLGDSACAAYTNAVAVSGAGGVKISRCPFSTFASSSAIGVLNHAKHTGIYQTNGTINENVWQELCSYGISTQFDDREEQVITKNQFYKFLTARRQAENKQDTFAELASNAEWKKYWEIFGMNLPGGDQYVTLQNLRDFFEDSSKPGKVVEHRVTCGF